MDLRRATADDLDTLMALISEYYRLDRHRFDTQRVSAALRPLLAGDDFGLVWILDTPCAGYVVVTWGFSLESGGREALIDEFYLRERGTGLGTRVLEWLIADCRRRGCRVMFLETERHNARVRRLYRRAGFEEDDSVWMSRPLL